MVLIVYASVIMVLPRISSQENIIENFIGAESFIFPNGDRRKGKKLSEESPCQKIVYGDKQTKLFSKSAAKLTNAIAKLTSPSIVEFLVATSSPHRKFG